MAYVGGWLGHNNLGDEALREAYRVLFPGISLCCLEGHREEVSFARITKAFDSAVLAGGTLINKNDKCLARARAMLEMAERRFVFGTGVASSAFWGGRQLRGGTAWSNRLPEWRDVLERCDYVGVRGPLSQNALTEAGLRKVEVVGDPVLVFADCSRSAHHHERTLGLNLGVAGGNMWASEERLFERVTELAALARNNGWKVVWFVVWPDDYEPTRRVAKESRTDEHICAIYTDHAKYRDEVSNMSVFVGMKLHAVVLATCVGVPSIMLEYRPKCRDYMESIRQGHLCRRLDLFVAQEVWERVLDIERERQRYADDMAAGISQLQAFQRDKAREMADRMASPLPKGSEVFAPPHTPGAR